MHNIGYYIAAAVGLLGAGGYLYAKYYKTAEAKLDAAAKSAGGKLSKL